MYASYRMWKHWILPVTIVMFLNQMKVEARMGYAAALH